MHPVRRLQQEGIRTGGEGQGQMRRGEEPPLPRVQSCQDRHGGKEMTERLIEGVWVDEKEEEE